MRLCNWICGQSFQVILTAFIFVLASHFIDCPCHENLISSWAHYFLVLKFRVKFKEMPYHPKMIVVCCTLFCVLMLRLQHGISRCGYAAFMSHNRGIHSYRSTCLHRGAFHIHSGLSDTFRKFNIFHAHGHLYSSFYFHHLLLRLKKQFVCDHEITVDLYVSCAI